MKLLALLCTTISMTALGNIGGYATGVHTTGAFKPIGIEQVEMVSERLEIDLHIEYAEIRIEYVLHNPGPKVAVQAGFPSVVKLGPFGQIPNVPLTSLMSLENFQLQADGEPVKTSIVPDDLQISADDLKARRALGPCIKGWHMSQLAFKKGQTRQLSIQYRQPYGVDVISGGVGFNHSAPTLGYIFSSAAAWKGAINHGSVIIRAISVNPDKVQLSHPARFKREDNKWTWLFTDLEPTLEDDLTIVAAPAYHSPSMEGLPESDPRSKLHYIRWDKGHPDGRDRWELHSNHYSINASSTLAADGPLNYVATNLMTSWRHTSWAEGVPGAGIGETLTLTLAKPSRVSRIGIVNGYAQDQERYDANNRVKRLEVRVNDGKPFAVTVPDERLTVETYYFDLPEPHRDVKTITLTIAEVYKGTKFDDTCLTHLVLVTPLSKEPKLPPVR